MHLHLSLLLLLPVCFLTPGTQAGEIIGGHEARPNSRPYMVYLKYSRQDFQYTCGGFLIQADFVLTAAHCRERSYNITLGAHDINKRESSQQFISVSRDIPHPDYDSEKKFNDIMLLKLTKKANLTSAVQLLNLPNPSVQVRPGQVCSVAGWGRTSAYNRESSNTLQEVNLIMQDDYRCESLYRKKYDKRTQLCVGDLTQIKNPLQGDSGGPLVCNNMAQGIVSYGDPCGIPPAVYTKVSSFLPWIKETMKKFP